MQVTSLQHRTLQPAVGCNSSGRATRQQVSARSRAVSAASAQDVDQVSAEGTQHNANPMEFEELSDIIKMVHSTDIVEFELRSKRFSLAVRKKEALVQPEPVYIPGPHGGSPPPYYQSQPQGIAAPPPPPPPTDKAPSSGGGGGGGNGSGPSAEPVVEGYKMASPMAGSFYRSPAPGEPSFCKEGDKVTKGQTVCIIEAMKLMNEIEADVSGTVVKWLVDNGAQITPGQELLVIKQ
ncbi:hypothetical protein ABBQ32_008858 [Trebouxia sp. C0010 RCD-2024]